MTLSADQRRGAINDLDSRLASALRYTTFIQNGEQLGKDIQEQVEGVDRVARHTSPNEITMKQVWVRRAALTLLQILKDPQVTKYEGFLSRGEKAPSQPQFIALFSHSDFGKTVIKTYGFSHEHEPNVLRLYRDNEIEGVVKLLASGVVDRNTWVMLEHLTGPSLTAFWDQNDRPTPPKDALAETRQLAALAKRMHEVRPTPNLEFPHIAGKIPTNAQDAIGWLNDNGYGNAIKPGAEEFVRSAYDTPRPTLLIGEPFAANIVRNPDGGLTVIDPTPMMGPASFDAAYWISHTADPRRVHEMTVAWTQYEPGLDTYETARCLAAELLRHAGVLEIVKRETDQDWTTRDLETYALIASSNALRDGLEFGRIESDDDINRILAEVSHQFTDRSTQPDLNKPAVLERT
jgi:hypothetical protein